MGMRRLVDQEGPESTKSVAPKRKKTQVDQVPEGTLTVTIDGEPFTSLGKFVKAWNLRIGYDPLGSGMDG